MRVIVSLVVIVGLMIGPAPATAAAAPEPPVVRAVLFWSKECPACYIVVQEVLPPIERQHGDRLDIRRLEMTDPMSVDLYLAAARMLGLARDEMVVPLMVVGSEKLIGWREIRDRLPGLVRVHLAEGGLGWPAIPGLDRIVGLGAPPDILPEETSVSQPASLSPPASLPAASSMPRQPAIRDDPVGFTLALVVMAAMLGSLAYAFIALLSRRGPPRGDRGSRIS